MNNEGQEKQLFRDFINPSVVSKLANRIKRAYPDFELELFCQAATTALSEMSLKQRTQHIAESLHKYLPQNFEQSCGILLQSLPTKPPGTQIGDTESFIMMSYTYFVSTYGLHDFERSMGALKEMTKYFSSEFDVRPFIIRYEAQALNELMLWTTDPSEHVRRLVSEGTRPRLPWGMQLKPFIEDPSKTLQLLQKLYRDPSIYVRKSVANHLNDISKDHPMVVVTTLKNWLESDPTPQTIWICKHALRTLIKKGHKESLALLGIDNQINVSLQNTSIHTPKVAIGGTLHFSFELTNTSENDQDFIIDYQIYFVKANGALSPKVYKLTNKHLKSTQTLSISKRHSFKMITTRVYYPGTHKLSILVNGHEFIIGTFEVVG